MSKWLKQVLEDTICWFTGVYPEDNHSYLIVDCPMEEILKKLPLDLRSKLVYTEYKSKEYDASAFPLVGGTNGKVC